MSARRLSEPDDCTAIAPMIHAIPSPTHAVSTAPSSPSTVRRPGNRSSERACTAEPLEAAGEHAAGEQRAEQTEQRRVLRVRAAREDQRRQPGPEERADREPGERQRPDDEALHVPVQGEQHDEGDDHPVDRGHAVRS